MLSLRLAPSTNSLSPLTSLCSFAKIFLGTRGPGRVPAACQPSPALGRQLCSQGNARRLSSSAVPRWGTAAWTCCYCCGCMGRDYWRAVGRLRSHAEVGDFGRGHGEIHSAGSVLLPLPVGWMAKHFKVSPSVPSQGGSAAT